MILYCFARVLRQHTQKKKSIYAFILRSFTVARTQEEANLPLSETDSEQLHALLPKVLGEVSKTALNAVKLHLYMRQTKPGTKRCGDASTR